MKLPIYQIDAFTDTVFKGNPAAVMPLQQWLPEELMQQIAMENNLAETAFLVPLPANDTSGAHYHIRWFTPALEIDLCGHATVAAAFVLHHCLQTGLQQIKFTTERAGVLEVTITNDLYLLNFPSRMPEKITEPKGLFKALGITNAKEVRASRDYFVVLDNEALVRSIRPDFTLLKQLDLTGVIVTAPGDEVDVASRCFYPKAGIDEDPVTGSAHCNVVPYWSRELGKEKLTCKQISARGGTLWCEDAGERVLLGGKAVLFMQGEVLLPVYS